MTKDEVLKLSLYYLEQSDNYLGSLDHSKPIAAIKEALAQTQEPFAYVNIEKRKLEFAHDYVKWDTPTTVKLERIPLYTFPPQRTWVGLTDEEMYRYCPNWLSQSDFKAMMLHVEAKLKEKNT